ncbi:hypothetical protein [Parasitella parasitica]|uniref:F-box domain-containing protein n=1 Tax=Parasitella parasitica TaxID=35722 RepID=A0A0B7MVK2_9FUNG|nr:hypothetical protein [Parasitella parasitica]
MSNWRKLPTEVWLNVFNQVRSTRQLVQCRLACREWNPLAERAMFSSKLVVKSGFRNRAVKKLLEHVAKKPMLGRFPKEIHLEFYGCDRDFELITSLLALVIHSHITRITGSCLDVEIYDILHQLAQNPPLKMCKLKTLPSPSRFNQQYYSTACVYKDTLEHLELDCDILRTTGLPAIPCKQLREFKSLSSLKLVKHDFNNILELDEFLQTQQNLQELTMAIDFIPATDYVSKDQKEMAEWLEHKNIQRNYQLKQLTFEEPCIGSAPFANLVDYLVFKYPELEELNVDSMELTADVKQMLNTIRHIPFININNCIGNMEDTSGFVDIIQHQKSASNTIDIRYENEESMPQPEINAYKEKETQKSRFEVSIPGDITDPNHLNMLASLKTENVAAVSVDFMHRRIYERAQKQRAMYSLYDIFKSIPQMQCLYFTDMEIHYQKLKPGSLILNDLSKLQLQYAKMSCNLLPQLSNIAPNLTCLELDGSIVLDENRIYSNAFDISMPYTYLKELSISLGAEYPDLYDDDSPDLMHMRTMQAKLKITGPAYLRLLTGPHSNKQARFFMLLTARPALELSEPEFLLHAHNHIVFNIDCKQLESLDIKLGQFIAQLSLDSITGKQVGNWDCIQKLEQQCSELTDSNKK